MDRRDKHRNILTICSFLLFIITLLWYTILSRPIQHNVAQTDAFWSYRRWLEGNTDLGMKIIANIAMFIPFGFFVSMFCKRNFLLTILMGAICSMLIETLQIILMRGLFEWDDVINNTFGTCLGWLLLQMICKREVNQSMNFITAMSIVTVLICLGVFAMSIWEDEEIQRPETLFKQFCFHVNQAENDNDILKIEGFSFRYGQKPVGYSVLLRPVNGGKDIELDTEYGIERQDVNQYFACEYDYSHTGFIAIGAVNSEEEYEVMIQWPLSVPLPTGVYLTGNTLHYFPENEFVPPELNEIFISAGIPRLFRPDRHCWVYQYGNELYWVVDKDFFFEDDGTTRILYQIWTTQSQNLSLERRESKYNWDNKGGNFENDEIFGDFGTYRVMKRKLPSEYSIMAIVTGYHRASNQDWRECFRPFYTFDDINSVHHK